MIVGKFKGYLINILIIWFAVAIYKNLPYYINFLRNDTVQVITIFAYLYTIIGLIYYIITPKENVKKTKGELLFSLIHKLVINTHLLTTKKYKIHKICIEKIEKVASLFILVKFFFLPIMLNFVFANYHAIKNQLPYLVQAQNLFTVSGFNSLIYPFLLAFLFFIDTLWFAFGYATEASFLKNKIVSVEPTILGWAVALICYPPFNGIFTKAVGWYANDYALFSSDTLTFIMRIISVILVGIYVSATLALGPKSSNLTHRGIVTRGPYSIIRHPAYISKNLVWWITLLPALSFIGILSMAIWSTIYHLRAITEERHLGKDPKYQEYCKQVRYRYIPKIY